MSTEQEESADYAADDALQDLFARAAPRATPPPADADEIRRAVLAEWDAVAGRRVRLRRAAIGVATAAMVGVVAVLAVNLSSGPPPPMVARVERLHGTVQSSMGGTPAALHAAEALQQGAIVATGNGQVALRLAAGGSLRVAPQSRVALTEGGVELLAGSLYFDSEEGRPLTQPFVVVTALGTVRDVGTQFMTRLEPAQLVVGVRDGRIAVARGTDNAAAAEGERLTVANGGGVRRDTISTFGEEWSWVDRLAPPFDIDGRRLSDFLSWIERQTGRDIAFADSESERVARETRLTGSIDLEPMPKLMAVLALTDLDYALDGSRILISTK